MKDCVFCKIVKGETPSHKVWEDDKYLAFLSIQPSEEGLTLVIPKEHQPSYFVNVDQETMCELIERSKIVAKILDSKLEKVRRTKLVFEGLEVDHLHARLHPMYEKGYGKVEKPVTKEALSETQKKLTE